MLAAGFDVPGARSQREWAEQQKLSPEHASNDVLDWQRMLKLGKTSAQKSAAACEAYRGTNGKRGTL